MAKTFWDDPVSSSIFRNGARRDAGLRAYFRTQLRADYLPFGGCYTTDGYAGSAIWAPAGVLPATSRMVALSIAARAGSSSGHGAPAGDAPLS